MDVNARAGMLKVRLRNAPTAPILRRGNGFGFCLLGVLRDDLLKGAYFKMYWFTALWVPIIPIRVFLVDRPIGNSYRFLKTMTLSDFHTIYRGRLAKFYLTVLGEAVFGIVVVIIAVSVVLLITLQFT